jgi:uncharacterized membrane protein YjfL (UPF0719 family)
MTMDVDMQWGAMVPAVVWAVLGLAIFGAAWFVFEKVTPYSLWKEIIEEHNTALAIVVGALTLALALIVAAAIR